MDMDTIENVATTETRDLKAKAMSIKDSMMGKVKDATSAVKDAEERIRYRTTLWSRSHPKQALGMLVGFAALLGFSLGMLAFHRRD